MQVHRILFGGFSAICLTSCGGNGGGDGSVLPASITASGQTQASALIEDPVANKELATPLRPLAKSPFKRRYRVFSANGGQYTLDLDFSNRRYVFAPSDGGNSNVLQPINSPVVGMIASGEFSDDPMQPGTFVLQRSKVNSVVNLARFRLLGDAIVGTFPLARTSLEGTVGISYPFLGVTNLVSAQSAMDGTYNRFTYGTPFQNVAYSLAHQISISGGGTQLRVCRSDTGFYRLEVCPTQLLKTYAIVATERPGIWRLTTADTTEQIDFSVARVGGQNVYLAAGRLPNLDLQFRIGLPETTEWTAATMYGAFTASSTSGNEPALQVGDAWTRTSVHADSVRQSAVYADGNWTVEQRPLVTLANDAPIGARGLQSGNSTLYGARGAGLWAMVALPRPGTSEPYQNGVIGLWGTGEGVAVDPRNDSYTVFASNGTKQRLRLDFDMHQYEMVDESGHSVRGPFAADPVQKNVYVFATDRVAPSSAARFQVTIDAVIGAFPFLESNGSGRYALQPFVAARNLVIDATEFHLVGSLPRFNMFSVARGAGIADSTTSTFDLYYSGANTPTLGVCSTDPLKPMCTPDRNYSVTTGSEAGDWVATNTANASDNFHFSVARIGGKNVYLRAAVDSSNRAVFEVGLTTWAPFQWPANSFPLTVSTLGGYGSGGTSVNAINTVFNQPDGSSLPFSITLEPISTYPTARPHASGIRIGWDTASPADQYDATVEPSALLMVVGRSGNPATQGYLQLVMGGRQLSDPP